MLPRQIVTALMLLIAPAILAATPIKPIERERCPEADLPTGFDPGSVADMEKFLQGSPRIIYAMGRDRHQQLKHLLAAGENPNVCVQGTSPLAISAMSGDLEQVHLLLEGGAHPDKPMNSGGNTPLMTALSMAKFDVARLLLTKGADPRHTADGGITTLHQLAIARLANAPAIKPMQLELAAKLLAAGVPIDAQATPGSTALMLAVAARNRELVAFLLQQGAHSDIANRRGATAHSLARQTGDSEMATLFESLPNGAGGKR